MFHRRKPSNPARTAPPSQSAALAAVQAFGKPPGSNASLSASAAAAALRSHTPPPTNPADLQTKRMIRRGSNSSRGSDIGSISRPGLQRVNSNGSMAERSFRSPSPARSTAPVQADPNAPPVPALPNAIRTNGSQHKRSSSMEPQARVISPPPRRAGGRGMSVDTSNRSQQVDRRAANLSHLPPVETGKRNSVNFSRPMSPPITPQKPSPSSPRSGRTGWFTAPLSSDAKMRKASNDAVKPGKTSGSVVAYQTQQSLQNTANMPVYKNKNVGNALPPEGSRLSNAVKGMDSSKYAVKYDPNTRTMQRVAVAPEPEPEISSSLAARVAQGSSPTVAQPAVSRSLAAEIERELSFSFPQTTVPSPRASGLLGKQPSTVRENREEEEKFQEPPPRNPARVTSPTQNRPAARTPPNHVRSNSLQPDDALHNSRGPSQSPSRQAHFADGPVILQNELRHDPPPRSLSPAKPALKQSPASSVRAVSPILRTKSTSRDASMSGSDDGKKAGAKKGVHVSFGDETQIIPDPLTSGLGTSKYASQDPWDAESAYDMSPRPDLPSFGSVRGRGRSALEAEPAEKVTETVSSSVSTSVSTLPPLEHSSDQNLGGLIKGTNGNTHTEPVIGDTEKPIAASEPLPPEVTTVEGTGIAFDSESSDDEKPVGRVEPILSPIQEIETPKDEVNLPVKTNDGASRSVPAALVTGDESGKNRSTIAVPDIAVQPATPGSFEGELHEEWAVVMPGGFSGSWDEDESSATNSAEQKPKAAVASPVQPSVKLPPVGPAEHVPQPMPDTIHEESSDNDSIYSDAEEELDDIDQFASIDAVVESPMPRSPVTDLPTATTNLTETAPSRDSQDVFVDSSDWKETKAYWSSLTRKQKEELEREAEQDRAAKAVVSQPVQTQRKKKAPPPPPVETFGDGQELNRHAQISKTQVTNAARTRQRGDSGPPSPKEEFHLRKSMRGPSANGQQTSAQLRQSMRSAPGHSSLRDSQTTAPRSPAKLVQPDFEPRKAQQKRQPQAPAPTYANVAVPASSSATKPAAVPPPLLRSNSSGSDSSFKRMRPASIMSDGGRYTMKRSMRGAAPVDRPEAPRSLRAVSPPARPAPSNGGPSSRFSLRSLSPPARRSQQPRLSIDSTASQQPQHTTPTMRDSSLRSSMSPTRFRLLGKNREPKVKAAAYEAPKASRPKFRSRLSADSDADSPIMRTKFTSRFADSDDEDDSPVALQDLAPVRGIPRRIGEADRESTDLDDESGDDVGQISASKASVSATTNGKPIGSALASGSMRGLESSKHAVPTTNGTAAVSQPPLSPRKEKRPFFGMSSWRKRSGSVSSVQTRVPEPTYAQSIAPSVQQTVETPSPLQARGKLQRRTTRESIPRTNSDMWQLPPPPKMTRLMSEDEDRPVTSDGAEVVTNDRPDIGNRRSTVDGSTGLNIPPARELRFDESSIVGVPGGQGTGIDRRATAGKKKKFGILRRAFKLND